MVHGEPSLPAGRRGRVAGLRAMGCALQWRALAGSVAAWYRGGGIEGTHPESDATRRGTPLGSHEFIERLSRAVGRI